MLAPRQTMNILQRCQSYSVRTSQTISHFHIEIYSITLFGCDTSPFTELSAHEFTNRSKMNYWIFINVLRSPSLLECIVQWTLSCAFSALFAHPQLRVESVIDFSRLFMALSGHVISAAVILSQQMKSIRLLQPSTAPQ